MPTGGQGLCQVSGTRAIWLLYNNEWHYCPTQNSFFAWGYSWADVQIIDLATWCQYEIGQRLSDDGSDFTGDRGYIPSSDRDKLVCPVIPPPPKYKCPHCGATFSSQADLDKHIQEVHPPPPAYPCPHCGAVFSSQADLDRHIASEHPPQPPQICPLCEQNLGITGIRVEVIQEGPIFGQLRDEIAALNTTIADLEGQIAAVRAEIERIKKELGV